MKISLIIPVYNEELTLSACLWHALNQELPFYEIIVVDNNSTDSSKNISQAFNGVKYITEYKQGVTFAANKGFSKACGDIIARIDGDTLLPPDWSKKLTDILTPGIDAVSGSAKYYDVITPNLINSADLYLRRKISIKLNNHNYLWGANMAIKRQAWLKIRNNLCLTSGLHEDVDLALHLQNKGYTVKFDEVLVANVSSRRVNSNLKVLLNYVYVFPKTYSKHRLNIWIKLLPTFFLLALIYLPWKMLFVANLYKENKSKLLKESRPDPTVNVV